MTWLHEYVTPLAKWLEAHPYLALEAVFIISFLESLPIIGTIIPGSLTLTALGALAGAGVMRIDLTFISAVLGALLGDGLSFFLGLYYSDQLPKIWPFRAYPKWLNVGRTYFDCHGGKSVIIGRFIGPLRSVIPMIAGMMHMHHWRFFIANFIAAIVWSIVYIFPGILIGEASNTLSPENTTRLIILMLSALIALWLATRLVRLILRPKKGSFFDNTMVKVALLLVVLGSLIAPVYFGWHWILSTINNLMVKL